MGSVNPVSSCVRLKGNFDEDTALGRNLFYDTTFLTATILFVLGELGFVREKGLNSSTSTVEFEKLTGREYISHTYLAP